MAILTDYYIPLVRDNFVYAMFHVLFLILYQSRLLMLSKNCKPQLSTLYSIASSVSHLNEEMQVLYICLHTIASTTLDNASKFGDSWPVARRDELQLYHVQSQSKNPLFL